VLHITNGDAALEALTRAGIAAEDILPWRDVRINRPDALTRVLPQFLAEIKSRGLQAAILPGLSAAATA